MEETRSWLDAQTTVRRNVGILEKLPPRSLIVGELENQRCPLPRTQPCCSVPRPLYPECLCVTLSEGTIDFSDHPCATSTVTWVTSLCLMPGLQ